MVFLRPTMGLSGPAGVKLISRSAERANVALLPGSVNLSPLAAIPDPLEKPACWLLEPCSLTSVATEGCSSGAEAAPIGVEPCPGGANAPCATPAAMKRVTPIGGLCTRRRLREPAGCGRLDSGAGELHCADNRQ